MARSIISRVDSGRLHLAILLRIVVLGLELDLDAGRPRSGQAIGWIVGTRTSRWPGSVPVSGAHRRSQQPRQGPEGYRELPRHRPDRRSRRRCGRSPRSPARCQRPPRRRARGRADAAVTPSSAASHSPVTVPSASAARSVRSSLWSICSARFGALGPRRPPPGGSASRSSGPGQADGEDVQGRADSPRARASADHRDSLPARRQRSACATAAKVFGRPSRGRGPRSRAVAWRGVRLRSDRRGRQVEQAVDEVQRQFAWGRCRPRRRSSAAISAETTSSAASSTSSGSESGKVITSVGQS